MFSLLVAFERERLPCPYKSYPEISQEDAQTQLHSSKAGKIPHPMILLINSMPFTRTTKHCLIDNTHETKQMPHNNFFNRMAANSKKTC